MKTTQAISGAVVAALGLAALVTFYDEFMLHIQTPLHPNEAAQKGSLTPANSIAHDFAVLPETLTSASPIAHDVLPEPASPIAHDFASLPESLHTTPATSISQELDEPNSVHTVLVRPEAPSPAPPAVAVAPTASPPSPRVAAVAAVEPVDVCARYGGHRVNFMREHHAMWRCDYPRRR